MKGSWEQNFEKHCPREKKIFLTWSPRDMCKTVRCSNICDSKKKLNYSMSINKGMKKCIWYSHIIRYLSEVKMNALDVHVWMWMMLKHAEGNFTVLLKERYRTIPLTSVSKMKKVLLLMDTAIRSKNIPPWTWTHRKIPTPGGWWRVRSGARKSKGRFKCTCKL